MADGPFAVLSEIQDSLESLNTSAILQHLLMTSDDLGLFEIAVAKQEIGRLRETRTDYEIGVESQELESELQSGVESKVKQIRRS